MRCGPCANAALSAASVAPQQAVGVVHGLRGMATGSVHLPDSDVVNHFPTFQIQAHCTSCSDQSRNRCFEQYCLHPWRERERILVTLLTYPKSSQNSGSEFTFFYTISL